MNRRKFTKSVIAASLVFAQGCSSNSSVDSNNNRTTTEYETEPDYEDSPEITYVDVTEVPDPRGLNKLGFQVGYKNLESNKNYSIEVVVKSDAGSSRRTRSIRSEFGLYAGLTGTEIKPHEETSTEDTVLEYVVRLFENSELVDDQEGEIEYE